MATSLVTGASGFVGRRVVAALAARGDAVRALIRDERKGEPLLAHGVEIVVGNIRDQGTLVRALDGIDVVHHCAAAVGARYAARDFQEVNVEATRRLLEVARAARCRRVVLLSSLHVLGIGNLNPASEDLPYRRTKDAAANAKIDMEQMALASAREGAPSLVILRPGVIYGADDPHNLPKLISAIRRGKFIHLVSRNNIVPIVHVDDVAASMLLAADAPEAAGRIFHITDGSRTTIGQFVGRLAELTGSRRPRWVLPGPLVWSVLGTLNLVRRLYPRCPLPIQPGPLRFLATSRFVDIRPAREYLNYVPRWGHREGLANALEGDSALFQQGVPYVGTR
jgi:nucleoside-diphosphate-sugar epimerase